MALTALLFAHHYGGSEGEPATMRTVAGLSVIERQVRQARACGADRVIVVVERMPPRLAALLAALNVKAARSSDDLVIGENERVLVIEDALLVDSRVVAAVGARGGVSVWKGRTGPERSQRIDPTSHWAGVSVYPGPLVSSVVAGLGDWDLQATLLRAAFADEKPVRIDLSGVETYDAARHRDVPMIWLPVHNDRDAARATEALLDAGRSGRPDWPALLINSPIGSALARVAIGLNIRARTLQAASVGCGLAAAAAFGIGWLWPGLVFTLAAAPFRVAGRTLAWAQLDAPARDLPFPWIWYPAFALHLVLVRDLLAVFALLALFLLSSWGQSVHQRMFERFTKRPLDDAGDFERRLRLFGSGRDTNPWLLVPFAVFGAWYAGFVALAAYASVTVVVTQVRFFRRLTEYAREHAARMPANLTATEARSASNFWRWLSLK